MKVYGIASTISNDVDDWYTPREDAEDALAQVLADEPDFRGVVFVAEVDLSITDN